MVVKANNSGYHPFNAVEHYPMRKVNYLSIHFAKIQYCIDPFLSRLPLGEGGVRGPFGVRRPCAINQKQMCPAHFLCVNDARSVKIKSKLIVRNQNAVQLLTRFV